MIEKRIFVSESVMNYADNPNGSLSTHCLPIIESMFENEIIPWICERIDNPARLYDKYLVKQADATDGTPLNTIYYTLQLDDNENIGFVINLRPTGDNKIALSSSTSGYTNVIGGYRMGMNNLADSQSATLQASIGDFPTANAAKGRWIYYSNVKNETRDIKISIPVKLLCDDDGNCIGVIIGMDEDTIEANQSIMFGLFFKDCYGDMAIYCSSASTVPVKYLKYSFSANNYNLNVLLPGTPTDPNKAVICKYPYVNGANASITGYISAIPGTTIPTWGKVLLNGELYQRVGSWALFIKI